MADLNILVSFSELGVSLLVCKLAFGLSTLFLKSAKISSSVDSLYAEAELTEVLLRLLYDFADVPEDDGVMLNSSCSSYGLEQLCSSLSASLVALRPLAVGESSITPTISFTLLATLCMLEMCEIDGFSADLATSATLLATLCLLPIGDLSEIHVLLLAILCTTSLVVSSTAPVISLTTLRSPISVLLSSLKSVVFCSVELMSVSEFARA
mmetsp:Transcript_4569/g.6664  ORF Transcript_4569/g.6664 Transcript_4569/m.6664 type:complete len:210 (-) Transcript_4569:3283-3912(-)